ncbi:VOC family protein [Undibacterium curvum]|jgi:catechol 2,3-dioxygenase-like lactoylglutathione lyase family enzyme|uniref:VOC family protein n=1 Tax=Undibacterium curvum TaxID=2762294 RepID=UPI003D0D6064
MTSEILGLDHFTLRTKKEQETMLFFRDVIGLEIGWRPAFRFPGTWMYCNGAPILHIVESVEDNSELNSYLGEISLTTGGGAVDHISLRCKGLQEFQKRFLAMHIDFWERVVPEISEHQVFLYEPNGVRIELIFPLDITNKIVGGKLESIPMKEANLSATT